MSNSAPQPPQPQRRPVYIVTGGNAGIGKEVARQLVQKGHHVVLACRNEQACAAAKQELSQEAGESGGVCECGPWSLDLEDPASVRRFAEEQRAWLRSQDCVLACLVNNAGVMGVPPGSDGQDRHLVINHLGPYLLTRLLAPAMTHGSRVVTVTSRAHYMGHLSIRDDRIVDPPRHWWWQYGRSKLCNVLFTDELSRRLAPHGITSYGVSPGLVNTSIFRNLPGPVRWVMAPLQPWFFKTPQQGAASAVYAATAPELEGRSVPFIHDCKPVVPSAQARDRVLAARLWDVSATLVGLTQGPQGDEYW